MAKITKKVVIRRRANGAKKVRVRRKRRQTL